MPSSTQTSPINTDRIFHITLRSAWNDALLRGTYQPDSLEREGFIHCSQLDQVVGTAQRYFAGQFAGQDDLVLLYIRVETVEPEIRYEAGHGAMLFPHIYGPLNLDAVVQIVPFDATATTPPIT